MNYLPYSERTPDTQYQDLLRRIRDTGRIVHPIHGEDSKMVVGHQMRFDMRNGFPLLPIRDLSRSFGGALGELIGFLHGARTLEELKEYGCPNVFWERWVTKEKCEIFGLPEHDLGDGSYGAAWANFPTPNGAPFNQVEQLLKQIEERPYLRTHILSPWIPFFTLQHSELTRKVVVAPCHGWVHILAFPDTEELALHHFQRSGDVPVGVTLNLVEYGALGMMIARQIGYTFTEYVYTISDAHMYESQFGYVDELLTRDVRPFPTVTLDADITTVLDARREHFTLTDYNPHAHMVIPTPT